MKEETLKQLCQNAKKECKVTWEDEGTNKEFERIVEDAVESMKHRLGMKEEPEEFLKPGMTRTLFNKYCSYDWNNMLDFFEQNYSREILAERHKYEVKYGKEKSEQLQ